MAEFDLLFGSRIMPNTRLSILDVKYAKPDNLNLFPCLECFSDGLKNCVYCFSVSFFDSPVFLLSR